MTKNRPVILLNESFPDWNDNKGIFSEMTNMPWSTDVSADLLDIDYFGNHSGNKKCSPLVYALMEDDFTLSDSSREKLAALVTAKFLPNWTSLWNTYHLVYDPIKDYNLTETGSNTEQTMASNSITGSGTNGGTDNTANIHGEQITDSGSETVTAGQGKYGFNSVQSVPTDTGNSSTTTGNTRTHSGTDNNNRTLNLTNSYTEAGTKSEGGSSSYSKSRSGITGAHSIQELIQRERELWIEDYFTRIFIDVDTVLASMIYNREHKVDPYFMFGFGYYAI